MTNDQQRTTGRLPDGTVLPDPARVVTEVRRLASESPKYVYGGSSHTLYCTYTANEYQSACIIGQAFMALGVPEQSLRAVDANADGGESVDKLYDDDGPAVDWLTQVQTDQDCNIAWGEAVTSADQSLGNTTGFSE